MPVEFCIQAEAGPQAGRKEVLRGTEVVIGRDPGCNFPLVGDPLASRVHAKIYFESGRWYIVDLGSTNGTCLNGQRIGPVPVSLATGCVIDIGSSRFRIEWLGTMPLPPARSVPPPVAPLVAAKRPWGHALQEAIAVYDHGLREVMQDGVITPEEAHELWQVQARLGLTEEDTRDARAQAFVYLNDLAIQNGRIDLISANQHLVGSLGFDTVYDARILDSLYRGMACMQMSVIAAGQLPCWGDSRMNLLDNEVSHVEIEASLLEERVVSSGWQSVHAGLSFRVAKGVRFNVGGTSGRRVSQKAVVPVSHGLLAITSERIAFLGNPKPFEARWKNIMGIEPYADGMTIFIANRAKAPTLQYDSPHLAEVIASVCSAYIS